MSDTMRHAEKTPFGGPLIAMGAQHDSAPFSPLSVITRVLVSLWIREIVAPCLPITTPTCSVGTHIERFSDLSDSEVIVRVDAEMLDFAPCLDAEMLDAGRCANETLCPAPCSTVRLAG